jgi:hypothetical protein
MIAIASTRMLRASQMRTGWCLDGGLQKCEACSHRPPKNSLRPNDCGALPAYFSTTSDRRVPPLGKSASNWLMKAVLVSASSS